MDDFALTHPEAAADEERLREHEADFTPVPVIRQCLKFAQMLAGWNGEPEQACDPAAGAGAWAMVMRHLWHCHVTAIEKRSEELPHLRRNADDAIICDAIDYAKRTVSWRFDVVATNPAFSLFQDYADNFLRLAPHVWLFAPVDANVRGRESSGWLATNAKWVQRCLWVPGGIGFRGPGKNAKGKPNGQDHRQYCLWMLTSDIDEVRDENGWPVTLLPRLPGHDRRWVIRPGTEQGW